MNFDRTVFSARIRIAFRLLAGGALLLLAGNPGGIEAGMSGFRLYSRMPLLVPTAILLLILLIVYTVGTLRNGRAGLGSALFLLAFFTITPSVRTPHPAWLAILGEALLALMLGGVLFPQDRRRCFQIDKVLKVLLRITPALLFLAAVGWWSYAFYAASELRGLPLLIPAILLALPALLAWRIDYAVKASRRLPLLAMMNVITLGILRLAVAEPALSLLGV